jgi:phosphoesterase RecJ-like protein
MVLARIREAKRPLIVSHRDPDPDSLGSALGLAAIFDSLGVEPVVAVSQPEKIDRVMAAIPRVERIVSLNRITEAGSLAERKFDALFAVDTASRDLFGVDEVARDALMRVHPLVNIDHHITNNLYGDVNYIVADAAAAAEIIWLLLSTLNIEISCDGAIALQAGLVADTLGFQTPNTRPRTLRAAAGLMKLGGATSDIPRRVLSARTYEASRLLGLALAAMESSENGRLVWTKVTEGMATTAGIHVDDVQGVPNALQDILGAVITAVFYEIGPSHTRVSLRSHGPRIDGVAAEFGGGGHALAAGATLDHKIDEAAGQVLTRLQDEITTAGNGSDDGRL